MRLVTGLLIAVLSSSLLAETDEKSQARQPQKEDSGPLSPQELFKRVSPAVFVIESLNTEGLVVAQGSGVAVAASEVVTNAHVIEGGVSWRVRQEDKAWPASVTHLDADHDLCQMQVEGLQAQPVNLRSSSTIEVGERVYAIGAPSGLEQSLSEGIVSGIRTLGAGRIIQTTAAISPGSSGGGLFDAQGRLVGITSLFVSGGQTLNFAIPVEWIAALGDHPFRPRATENANTNDSLAEQLRDRSFDAYSSGRREEALRILLECVRLDPDYGPCWMNLGSHYQELGQHEHALEAFLQTVRIEPDSFSSWYLLAEAYEMLDRDERAIQAYGECIRLYPAKDSIRTTDEFVVTIFRPVSNCWRGMADAHFNLQRYRESIVAFEEAIRLKSNDALAWEGLGRAHDGLQQYDKAVLAYQEAIRIRPDFGTAWFNLGLAYSAQGKRTKVMEVHEQLKKLDPDLADQFFREVVLP